MNDVARQVDACVCVLSCDEDPQTACSHSGVWHVHPEFGRCPTHPDVPGDWPADELERPGGVA